MTNLAIKDNADPKAERETALGDALEAIKQQPLDTEIATVFVEMRESSGQSLEALSQQLGTNIGLLEDLEKGDLSHLPSWEVCSPIISNYTKMLGIDSKPILRRIALNIQARQKAESLKVEKGSQGSQGNVLDSEASLDQNKIMPVSSEPKRRDVAVPELDAASKQAPHEEVENPIEATDSLNAATIIPAARPSDIKYRPVERVADSVSEDAAKAEPTLLKPLPLQAEPKVPSLAVEQEATKILTPMKADLKDERALGAAQGLKVPLDEQLQQVKSQLQRYDQPLFDTGFSKEEPQLFGDSKKAAVKEDLGMTLRADKRDFSQDSESLLSPPINDLMQPKKKGLGLFSKVMIVFFLLAMAYIGWSLYSDPKLGEMLLDQLPFIAQTSV